MASSAARSTVPAAPIWPASPIKVAAAERVGYDGVWTTEVSRDPFLSLVVCRGPIPRG
jgi:hypothetical protein